MPIAFVIEVHVPYLRHPGRQPIGEERLHAFTAHTLIPLLDLMSELQRHSLPLSIALACSPIALEQWRDPLVHKHFVQWLEGRITHHQNELTRFEHEGNQHGAYLARFYLDWDRQLLRSFTIRYQRNPLGRLQELVAAGLITPLCVPASYAILPFLGYESMVRAQLEHGLLYISRYLKRPEGLWLPGSAWCDGLERIMLELDLRYVIVDPSNVQLQHGRLPGWLVPRRLAAIGVEADLARHIWSVELGYPGDPLYRNPADPTGYTANGADAPQPYDPYHALRRAQEHANHFVDQLLFRLSQLPSETTLVVPIDARLWSRNWFEGPTWLQAVLMRCATDSRLRLTQPGSLLHHLSSNDAVVLQATAQADASATAWQSPFIDHYRRALHEAERRFAELVTYYPAAEGLRERALTQAARELLLAEMSDWLIDCDPGWQRYLDRFDHILLLARQESLSATDLFALEQIESHDSIFPVLNYRLFGEKHHRS